MRKIIIILSSVFVFLLIAVIAAPFVIDLNKYKDRIITLAKPYLNREFDFADVKLTLISGLGVEINGLRIADNPEFGSEDFLSLQSLRIKVALFPLLKKKIQIKKLIMDEPVVRLVRNSNGVFNFSDMASDAEEDEKPQAKDEKRKEKKSGSEKKPDSEHNIFLAGLMVSQFTLHSGQIHFLDNFVPDAPVTMVFDSLNIELKNVSLYKPIRIYASAGLQGTTEQNLLIKGMVGPVGDNMDLVGLAMDIHVSVQNVFLHKFVPYIPDGLMLSPLEGILYMTANIKGSVHSGLDLESVIQGEKLVMSIKDSDEKIQNVNITLKEKIKYDDRKGDIGFQQLDLALNDNNVSLTGTIENIKTDPQWDVTLMAKMNALDEALALYPVFKEALPQDFRFTGPLNMEITSSGSKDAMQISGHTDMTRAEILYGEVFKKQKNIPFQISLKANKIADIIQLEAFAVNLQNASLNSSGSIEDMVNPRFDLVSTANEFSLKGWDAIVPLLKEYEPEGSVSIKNYMKGNFDDAFVNLHVSSPKLLFKFPASSDKKEDENTKQRKDVAESIRFELLAKKLADNITADGGLEMGNGTILDINFEEAKGKYSFQDDILKIQSFQMRTFEGDISLTGNYDSKSMQWDASPIINAVRIDGVVDAFTQYRGMMKGVFSGSFDMGGSLGKNDKMVTNANGSFRLLQGEIENVNLMETIIDSLLRIKEVYKYAGEKKDVLEKYDVTRFDSLDGEFSLLNDMLDLKKCYLENIYTPDVPGSDAKLKGDINFDTGKLDLSGKVILSSEHSEKLTKKAKPLKALLNEKGNIVLPVTVTGTMSNPKPLLDTSYVLNAMMNYYGKEELEKGLDKLKGKLGLEKLGLEKLWQKD
ncbi:MAG: AsmA family protein [Planctomycetia bacterium]|uniref:AsmA family protein n=1 Tax=Candidatus Kuenenia sp. TaxID=2499824 RepID=UPI001D9DC8AF|nr:AsmA family protein [Planctomycetia bacterium]